jgi:hypothetical protein
VTRHLVSFTELSEQRVDERLGAVHLSKLAVDTFGISRETFEQQLLVLVRELRAKFSDEYADRVRESFLSLPLSFTSSLASSAPADLSDTRDFFSIADSLALIELRNQVDSNEMVDAQRLYDDTLATYVSMARRAVIYDPYAGDAISSRVPGRRWLFKKLVESQILDIEIHSFVPQGKWTESTTQSKSISQTLDQTRNIHAQARRPRGTLRWYFYEPDKSRMHRRLLRLYFDRKSIDFQLEQGLDTFGRSRIFETYVKELKKPELTPFLHHLPRKVEEHTL